MGTERPWQPHCCAGESKAQGLPCSARWEHAVGLGGGGGIQQGKQPGARGRGFESMFVLHWYELPRECCWVGTGWMCPSELLHSTSLSWPSLHLSLPRWGTLSHFGDAIGNHRITERLGLGRT